MVVTVVGVGLIGGSMALGLKKTGAANRVIGVGTHPGSLTRALELQIIDEELPLLDAVRQADLIYIAIPVDATVDVVKQVMDMIGDGQVVTDAGSTKEALCDALKDHPRRSQFVAAHPMWGTEFSGPEAAVKDAFAGRACVICEKDKSSETALQTVEKIYRDLQMHIIYMNAQSHDVHAAYISHISHITSFALANTVLEKEREEDTIFEMAGGGFDSTVRLAKSSSAMWAPIFMQNRENVLDVLNEHITQLRKFKASIEKENMAYLVELIENANKISRILK
jgi:prephenate dehydrogenase